MYAEDLIREPLPKVKVGIGSASKNDNSVKSAAAYDGVTVYTDPDLLINDLYEGKIDAAVRGDMSSSILLPKLKEKFELGELQRVVLLQPVGKKLIFVAPVGIDEGWTAEQKCELAVRSIKLMRRLGMGEKIAVMSGGRKDDRGRNPLVDISIDNALEVTDILKRDGYDAYHAEILIESASDDADLIIAPDGISGNLIFRTLHFMGGATAMGAPVINMDKVFIDTSRVKTDYTDSIALAMRLTERMK